MCRDFETSIVEAKELFQADSEDYAEDIWHSLTLHVFPFLATTSISKINARGSSNCCALWKPKVAWESEATDPTHRRRRHHQAAFDPL